MSNSLDEKSIATRRVLAASFAGPGAASRVATALVSAVPGKMRNTAILFDGPDGPMRFVNTMDWVLIDEQILGRQNLWYSPLQFEGPTDADLG